MLLGLPLISAIARPRQVRKLPRCESGGGRVLCPYHSCRCRRATTAMPEISEFRFAPDSPVEEGGFETSVPRKAPGVPAVPALVRAVFRLEGGRRNRWFESGSLRQTVSLSTESAF